MWEIAGGILLAMLAITLAPIVVVLFLIGLLVLFVVALFYNPNMVIMFGLYLLVAFPFFLLSERLYKKR